MITARGGSKGVPGKNLKLLAGKPMLAYTIEAARSCDALDRMILSTEDAAIAELGRSLGCEVPFIRPAELSRDDTPHLPVIQHAATWMRDHAGYTPDAVMVLQPTSPLRTSADIAAAIALLASSGADSVLSVSAVPGHSHPSRTLRLAANGEAVLFATGEPVRKRINRRQDLPEAWVMNGAIYAVRAGVLLGADPSLYGDRVVAYRMPAERSISIDDMNDWAEAERLLAPSSPAPLAP
ncbi:MAG: acylneuraminate cytidylyltransferase family protein [Acidobacteriota bacterium]|nr:acylneuraminate cytidylyltransferase family protein [Acidobacteriota bacterium]